MLTNGFPFRARSLALPVTVVLAVILSGVAMAADVPVPANLCSVAHVEASSYQTDRFHPWFAVDGQPVSIEGSRENAWCSAQSEPSAGQWLMVQFPRPEQLSQVQVWYRVIAGFHRFVPRTMTIQSSMDGESWHTLVSRSTNVPRAGAAPDTEPRTYPCEGTARFVRLLFEDGAQPDELYDAVEVVELIIPAPAGWEPPSRTHAAQRTYYGSPVISPVLPQEEPILVLEDNFATHGRLRVGPPLEPLLDLRKPHGEIGTQTPVALPQFPAGHFERMLTSNEDVWGVEVLSKPGDPSFENVAGFTYPYKYPQCYAGVREGSVEPIIAWDGSVAYNETGDYMSFGLNGARIPNEKAYDVYRGLLGGYLPAPDIVYLDRELKVGWEQQVVCDDVDGQTYTFVRLRLRNYGDQRCKFEFSVFPFVAFQTSQPRKLTFANIRTEGSLAYVGAGLKQPGFWLSEMGSVREDRIAYDLLLDPGEQWQLVIKFNGDHAKGGPAETFLSEIVPRSIFAALHRQAQQWAGFLTGGMTLATPEPKLNDIIRASACHTFVDVDGDVVKGGAFDSYDIHYPLLTMRIVRYCLDWGYFDNARRYLEYLLAQPLHPADGSEKSLFIERGTSPVYDGGYFLQVLARYHQYTRDDGFIVGNIDKINHCVDYILEKRRASLEKEPAGSPKRGLIIGRTTGDLSHASYAYCNDAPSWRGLEEISKVLADIAKRKGDSGLTVRAQRVADEAAGYRRDILRSIKQVTVTDSDPPFVPIIVDQTKPYPNMHLNSLVSYTNFRMYNHLLDAGILDEETTGWILDYRKQRGGELLGMIRWGNQVDNFLCEDVQWEKLRLERIREFLLNFYAYITYDLVPGVWTGYEEFSLDPMVGQAPPGRSNLKHSWWPKWKTRMTPGYEQTRVSANIPELARFILVQAERDRDLLWLGRAIPRHWLTEGKQTVLGNAPTRWGKLSLTISSTVDSKGTISALIDTPGDGWPRINLRLRHPAQARLKKVLLNGEPYGEFDAETVHLPAGLSGRTRVEAYWE